MLKHSILVVLSTIALITINSIGQTNDLQAQSIAQGWTQPILLLEPSHTQPGHIRRPFLTADQMGNVHAFWTYSEANESTGEIKLADIYYTQNRNGSWISPIDIIASKEGLYPTGTIDLKGQIHLLWGDKSPVYNRANLLEANSAHNWTKSVSLEVGRGQIMADSVGQLHAVGTSSSFVPSYQRSENEGASWSPPVEIGQPSTVDAAAVDFHLAIDKNDNIHVVWTEYQLPNSWPPLGVFYTHSTDGGKTWLPIVEIAGPGHDDINIVVADNNVVHVAWNAFTGGVENIDVRGGRYHRWSSDGGLTWSETTQIMAEGFTEGPPQLAVDSAGTLHFLTTAGQRVWYSTWQDGRWGQLMYIPSGNEEGIPPVGETIDPKIYRLIEQPAMTITEGNRLHVIFWDERPEKGKYVWYTTKLVDAPAVPTIPFASDPTINISTTPTPNSTLVKKTSPALPTETPEPSKKQTQWNDEFISDDPNPTRPLYLGTLPVVFLIGGLILYRLSFKQKN